MFAKPRRADCTDGPNRLCIPGIRDDYCMREIIVLLGAGCDRRRCHFLRGPNANYGTVSRNNSADEWEMRGFRVRN